jgi:hypothetical protein
MEDGAESRSVRVFVSYSHDSTKHETMVLALCDRLRNEGVDACLDQYEAEDGPPEGWPIWMQKQIESSDFVLLVCTEKYRKRVEKNEEPGTGLGVVWEGHIIYNHLYTLQGMNSKFIPVVFSPEDIAYIPVLLNSTMRYRLETNEGYETLYRRLTGQPLIEKPVLGKVKALPPRAKMLRTKNISNTQYASPQIVSTISFSRDFPSPKENELNRDNIVNTLKTLASNIDVVIVEGTEGIGKTTLLSQFARSSPENTVSIFLSQDDRIGYDTETIKDNVADQIHWILQKTRRNTGQATADEMDEYAEALRRIARRRRQTFYFLIDGLGEVSATLAGGPKSLLEVLPPLGVEGIKFIVTGDLQQLRSALPTYVSVKSFQVMEFGLEDACRFYEGVINERDIVAQIDKLCGGIPAKLASIRRLIVRGSSTYQLIELMRDRRIEPFAIEWEHRPRGDHQRRILAQVAYDDTRYTAFALAEMINVPVSQFEQVLGTLSFMELEEPSGNLRFRSLWFRREAQQELRQFEKAVHKRIVRRLLEENPINPSDAGVSLDIGDATDLSELLARLSPDHIIEMLKRTQNITRVQ